MFRGGVFGWNRARDEGARERCLGRGFGATPRLRNSTRAVPSFSEMGKTAPGPRVRSRRTARQYELPSGQRGAAATFTVSSPCLSRMRGRSVADFRKAWAVACAEQSKKDRNVFALLSHADMGER
jgi:hypothetical protein